MKCLPALALPLLLSACASDVSPEDRDFFYHGWKNPEQSSRERMNGRGQANYFKPDDTARGIPTREKSTNERSSEGSETSHQ